MGSLQQTFLQDLRTKYPSNLDRDQLRRTIFGLIKGVMDMTTAPNSIVSKDLIEKAKKSVGRVLDVPVMKKGVVTINNVRSCTVACSQSDSEFVTMTFKTLVADICMVKSQYEKNEIQFETDFNLKMADMVEAFLKVVEDDIDTAFDANKSQVFGSTIVTDKYSLVANAIQVPESLVDFFFNDIDPINFADDFNSSFTKILSSHGTMPFVENFINQGSGNAENKTFQFAGKDFTFSNRITDAALKKSTGYFMPDGSVGLITRVDPDARDSNTSTRGTQWFEMLLPGMPFTVGVKYDSDCSDESALETSGLEHLKSTLIEHWQFSFDFSIVVPFNSDISTLASSIRKFEFVA